MLVGSFFLAKRGRRKAVVVTLLHDTAVVLGQTANREGGRGKTRLLSKNIVVLETQKMKIKDCEKSWKEDA